MKTFEFILQENVLSDNTLITPPKGMIFKGGYIAKIKEHEFQNAWSDRKIVKQFRSLKSLYKYLDKKYPESRYIDLTDTAIENNN
jgi:hypothetical protein